MTAHGPSALWYATRGTGAMALVLLTASVVLGIGEVRAWRPGGAPRFAIAAMHRTVSLLAVALLGVHIGTTLLDPFPPIARPQRGRPVQDRLSPALARPRHRRVRPPGRAGDHEPRPPAARLPRMARSALAGLRVLAGRAGPRDRRRLRHPVDVDARAHDRVRRGRAGRARSAARRGGRASRAADRRERGRGARGARARRLAPARSAGARLGTPRRDAHRRAGRLLAAHPPRSRPACGPPGAPLRRDAGGTHPQRHRRRRHRRRRPAHATRRRPARRAPDPSRGAAAAGGRAAHGPQRGDARPRAATQRATAGGSRSSTTP